MIQLPSLNILEVIEQKVGRKFPDLFKLFISEHQSVASKHFFEQSAFFVQSFDEIEKFFQMNSYSADRLLPFFIDTSNNDYYCFGENDKVLVFSDHAIVEEWKNFQEWLVWFFE